MTSLPMTDPVFDVHQQELQRVALEDKRARLEAHVQAARAIRAIEKAPGWKEFVAAVGKNRDAAVTAALDERCPNRDYWSGVAFGFSSILTIAGNAERVEKTNERELGAIRESLMRYNKDGRALPMGIGDKDVRQ